MTAFQALALCYKVLHLLLLNFSLTGLNAKKRKTILRYISAFMGLDRLSHLTNYTHYLTVILHCQEKNAYNRPSILAPMTRTQVVS